MIVGVQNHFCVIQQEMVMVTVTCVEKWGIKHIHNEWEGNFLYYLFFLIK